ncbi:MAG TPA: ComEC/Rec2 family competence protein, partial [Ktedonobacterales bacterium]|nr:ComEC/Rec2 family competence protein [Ktedonobacterales bacterium]
MATPASQPTTAPTSPTPGSGIAPGIASFGGYALVAFVSMWLAGIALYGAVSAFAIFDPWVWLGAALAGGVLALSLWVMARRFASPQSIAISASAAHFRWQAILRALPIVALLGAWLALGMARAAWSDPARDPLSVGRYATGVSYEIQGAIVEEPDIRDGYRYLTVQVSAISLDSGQSWQAADGRIEATVYGPDDWFAPAYGDTVTLTGKLTPLAGAYASPGVVARMSSARADILARGGGNPLLAWLFGLRVALARAIQRSLPEPEASLLIGILLGLKSPTLRARQALFVATGTIHLVVPAGLKVAVLAEVAGRAARRLGRWPGTIAALLAIIVYAALGGGGAAAERAAIMGALLALAPALGRAYNVFTALALAVLLMTVSEPLLIYDSGFQLTALATAGLPLLATPIQRRLLAWLGPAGRLPGATPIAGLVAVTFAAQIATAPVLAFTFHVVSLIAPLANLLTVPLLTPLLLLGGLLAALATVGGPMAGTLTLLLSWVVWPLLWFVDAVITFCAGLPFAALSISSGGNTVAQAITPVVASGLYYGALGLTFFNLRWLARRYPWFAAPSLPRRVSDAGSSAHTSNTSSMSYATHAPLARGLLIGVLAIALLGAGGAAAPSLAAAQEGQLDFLDVGAGGEAILLQMPSGVTALIDGGPTGPALETALAGRLPFWRHTLDLVALTDARAGNARGLEDAASHFTIQHALDSGMLHPSTEYLAYRDAMQRAGASRTQMRADDIAYLDATTTLRALAPPQELYPSGEGDTNESEDLILRLDTPGLRVLFLGDADAYALDALAGSGEPLAADVVALALPAGAPLDLSGPLGDVLALAHPRLIVICQAPAARKSKTHPQVTLGPRALWAADADAGQRV